jgi:hypothetical protein
VIGLIVIGLLVLTGTSIYRTGWSQGYVIGQLAARGGDGAMMPYPPYGYGSPGPLLTIGLILAALLVAGGLFRFWAWRTFGKAWTAAGGPKGEQWAEHWRRHRHGPVPPWCWGWPETPKEAEAAKADEGAEASTTQA